MINQKQISLSMPGACNSQRRSWVWATAAVGSLVLLLSVGTWAQESDQPLGDVVRKHKPSQRAARVVTNDEIPSVSPNSATPASLPLSSSKEEDAADASSASTSSRPESSSGRPAQVKSGTITIPGLLANGNLQEAQKVLEGLQHDRQTLVDNYDKIERKLAETNDESLRRVYSESLANRDARVAEKDKSIAQLENAIRAARDAQGGTNETQ